MLCGSARASAFELCLGAVANDLSRLRTVKSQGTKGGPTDSIRTTFEKCLRIALPSCDVWEMKGEKRVPITRKPVYSKEGVLQGYQTWVKRDGWRTKGWTIRRIQFKSQWQPGSPQAECIEWATRLGVTAEDYYMENDLDHGLVVRQLLESYPTYNKDCVNTLLFYVERNQQESSRPPYPGLKPPELVHVGDSIEEHTVKCTFKHPSGVLATDIWVHVRDMKKHYPDRISHL